MQYYKAGKEYLVKLDDGTFYSLSKEGGFFLGHEELRLDYREKHVEQECDVPGELIKSANWLNEL